MDYKIDIEEHDVLDNPVIKSIFPDISCIKKELTQYDEEPNIKKEAETGPQQSKTQDFQSNSSYLQNDTLKGLKSKKTQPAIPSNKISLGSKPNKPDGNRNINILGSNSNAKQHDYNKILQLGLNSNNADVQNEHRTHNALNSASMSIQDVNIKKQIFGLKPNTQDNFIKLSSITGSEKKVKHIKIVLKDINEYLNQNDIYCKQCCKLFLSKNAFDIHQNKVHYTKICENNNTQDNYIKQNSTTGSEKKVKYIKIVLKDINEYLNQNDRYCKQCSILFLSKNAFDIHQNKEHHTKIRANKNISIKMYSRKTQHRCSICCTCFSNRENLNRHYRNVHKKSLRFTGKDAKHTSETDMNLRSKQTKSNKRLKFNKIITKIVKKQTFNTPPQKHFSQAMNTVLNAGKIKYKNINVGKKTEESDVKNPIPMIIPVVKDHEKKTESNRHKTVKEKPFDNEGIPVLSAGRNCKVAFVDKEHAPKYVTRSSKLFIKNCNLCLHCKNTFPDQKSLIQHMYDILKPKKKFK